MDFSRGDNTAIMDDDHENSSAWMSADEAARSESLTSVSGNLAINDDAVSSPVKKASDYWEPEEQINDHFDNDDARNDAVTTRILEEEVVPFTIPSQGPQQHHEEVYTAAGEQLDHHQTTAAQQQQQPSPFAEEQYLTRPSGASLFSVPPSSAPHSGVYDMPLEAFEFRDLDSGRTFSLDKRFWIKDVDTGKVYVVEPDEEEREGVSVGGVGSISGNSRVGSAGGRSTPGSSSLRVSDLISGKELTLEEFEETLGYFRTPPELRSTSLESLNGDDDESDSERDLVEQAQLIAQRGLQSLSLGKKIHII
jgi:hypothetical protein